MKLLSDDARKAVAAPTSAGSCRGKADAGSATGDHGGLSIQSGHVVHPSLDLYGGRDLLI